MKMYLKAKNIMFIFLFMIIISNVIVIASSGTDTDVYYYLEALWDKYETQYNADRAEALGLISAVQYYKKPLLEICKAHSFVSEVKNGLDPNRLTTEERRILDTKYLNQIGFEKKNDVWYYEGVKIEKFSIDDSYNVSVHADRTSEEMISDLQREIDNINNYIQDIDFKHLFVQFQEELVDLSIKHRDLVDEIEEINDKNLMQDDEFIEIKSVYIDDINAELEQFDQRLERLEDKVEDIINKLDNQ